MGFPDGSSNKESSCSAVDADSIAGSERSPGGGNGNPLQYFCLGNLKEGCLAGYIPWGHKKSDMTEHVMDEKTYYNSNKNI